MGYQVSNVATVFYMFYISVLFDSVLCLLILITVPLGLVTDM